MASTTVGASTIANVAGSGVDWGTPSNAGSSDNSWATAVLSSGGASTSDPLRFTNFDLSGVPATASLTGFEISIECSKSGAGGSTGKIASVQLVDGGSATGTIDSTAKTLGTTDATVTYGGNGNMFGYSGARRDLGSAFGFQVIAQATSGDLTARIDYATLTIYWLVDGPRSRGVIRSRGR